MSTRPLGRFSDFVIEQMPLLLAGDGSNSALISIVNNLIGGLSEADISRVCADAALRELAAFDLKMVEVGVAHKTKARPPAELLLLVDRVSATAGLIPGLTYEELVLINPPDDIRLFTHGEAGDVERNFYLWHQEIEQVLGNVIEKMHRARNDLLAHTNSWSDRHPMDQPLTAAIDSLVKLYTRMDKEVFGKLRLYWMAVRHGSEVEGPSGAHSGAIPEMEVLLYSSWLSENRRSYITNHYQYLPRQNTERIKEAWRQPSLVDLVERENHEHQDLLQLMMMVGKFLVDFSRIHVKAVTKHLPEEMANRAPGTSVAKNVGDFLNAAINERQQHLDRLIKTFGELQ